MDTDELLTRLAAPPTRHDPDLLPALRSAVAAGDPVLLTEAGTVLADVAAEHVWPGARALRVAIAGTFTAESVAPLLRVLLLVEGIAARLHACPFDQVQVQLSDPDSELARFDPDVTLVLVHDGALLPGSWDPSALGGLGARLTRRVSALTTAVRSFTARSASTVVLHTVPLSLVEQRTVRSLRGRARLGRIWREVNTDLLAAAEQSSQVHVLDLEALLTAYAVEARDERLYRFAGMAWTTEVELRYATEAARCCRALLGRSRKVLVLDLDNTLWGGVLGDDGPEGIELGPLYPGNAHVELQRRARALSEQGVLLAVASKNDEAVVAPVLAAHAGMLLRTGDFVATAIDWTAKDVNLRRLADELDLGLDAFVFADDSRFECELVRTSVPDVAVVHLAGDPAGFARAVLAPDFFLVPELTSTDRDRVGLYRARGERRAARARFTSAADYLASLRMRVTVRPSDPITAPRLSQLAQRTNQFCAVKDAVTAGARSLAIEATDAFGAEGIVGGLWVRAAGECWVVENFVLSCRALGRGVEHAALHEVVCRAVAAGAVALRARLVRTDRNGPVTRFYREAGFVPDGDVLELPLDPPPELLPAWIELTREAE